MEYVHSRTELHCHTTASDGACTPAELIRLAKLRDVRLLAVTDHDTIDGHAEALAAGAQHGVRVIPGIEISSLSAQAEVHILGYGVAPADDDTRRRIADLRASRESRARRILANLDRLGKPVSFERVKQLAGDAMIGRPHIAAAMVEAGHVANKQQAFDDYLAEGRPAFAPNDALTPPQAVDLIHQAQGLAVVAHPGLFKGDLAPVLDELIDHGLDGIEARYPLHTPRQIAEFARIAAERGLLATGGSDFHGPQGDAELTLGSVVLPPEDIAALLDRLDS
jgi:predicted metal-dependent phosphoesterase TrpH